MTKSIENLQKSFELSNQQIDDAVNPLEVAAIFENERVSYVLIGGHMLSYYTGAARALKFAASISPNRSDENKPIDNADLLRLIRSTSKLKEKTLITLGDLIYPAGGRELTSVVKDVQNGKPINL